MYTVDVRFCHCAPQSRTDFCLVYFNFDFAGKQGSAGYVFTAARQLRLDAVLSIAEEI